MSASPTPIPIASPAATPECPIDARAAALARQYNAKGDLELIFIRAIAAAEITFHSIQRNIDQLCAAETLDDVKIDRLSRTQARYHRIQTSALKELRDLQQRRNTIERFPDQTKDCAPLADHILHVGDRPHIEPIPLLMRGRLHPPLDNTRWRYSDPDPKARAKGLPDIKRLVPDVNPEPRP